MATVASIVGPVLLLVALAVAHQARRWVARRHVEAVPSSASPGRRHTAAHEAMMASSIVAVVTLGAAAAILDAVWTPFTSGWALIALGIGAAYRCVQVWPQFGQPLHPSTVVLVLFRAGLVASVFMARFLIEGAAGVALALLVVVVIAVLLRWEDDLFDLVGLTEPAPVSWGNELAIAGIAPEEVRLRRFTMSTPPRGSGRVFLPSAAAAQLTPHQAVEVVAFNLQTVRDGRRWWLSPHVVWPSVLAASIAAPDAVSAVLLLAVLLIGISLGFRPIERRQMDDVHRRMTELAKDPERAGTLAQASDTVQKMTKQPPTIGRRGHTAQAIAERLGQPREETLKPPNYWPLAAKMLPISLAAAALPILLAAPTAWALGPTPQAVVAVGTDLGSDVEPAQLEAAILSYYGQDLDNEDVRIFVERAQREISRNVDDPDLHREAIAIYLAQCSGQRVGDRFFLTC